MKPFISVIIPALNEEHYIGTVLKALKSQTFKDFEVIVIDAKSTDKTVDVVKLFKNAYPLKIVSTEHKNISISRNLGTKHAKGDYLFFIDSDNSVNPDFLERVKEEIEKNNYEMIIPTVTPSSSKIVYRIVYFFVNTAVITSSYLKFQFSTGGNFVIKKDTFDKLGGFNEEIYISEDHEIVKRAVKKRVKLKCLNDLKIIFSVRRLEKEKASMIVKYIYSATYFAIFGKITHKIYNYPMGGHHYDKSKNKT